MASRRERPEVPAALRARVAQVLDRLPRAEQEDAWVGTRWRVGSATVCHLFGGEDQLFRITFRAESDEVIAFQHLGAPYFRAGWGRNVVGMLLDADTDWEELTELLTESYCLQAPAHLVEQVDRPA